MLFRSNKDKLRCSEKNSGEYDLGKGDEDRVERRAHRGPYLETSKMGCMWNIKMTKGMKRRCKKGCSQGKLYLNDKLESGNTKSGLKNMEEGGHKRERA